MKRIVFLLLLLVFACDPIVDNFDRGIDRGDSLKVIIGTGHNLYNLTQDQQWISFYIQNLSNRRINLLPFNSQGYFKLDSKIDDEWMHDNNIFRLLTDDNSVLDYYETQYDSVQILSPGTYRLQAIISDEKKLNADTIVSHEINVQMISSIVK